MRHVLRLFSPQIVPRKTVFPSSVCLVHLAMSNQASCTFVCSVSCLLDSHGSQQNWSLVGCDCQPDQKQSAPAELTTSHLRRFPSTPNKSEYKYASSRPPAPPLQSHVAIWCLQYSLRSTRNITPLTRVPHAVQSGTYPCPPHLQFPNVNK